MVIVNFQLVAGHPALDFANTLDYRYDAARRVELLPDFEAFVAFARQTECISDAESRRLLAATGGAEAESAIRRVRALREAVYFLFLSAVRRRAPGRAYLQTYNRICSEIVRPGSLCWYAGQFSMRHIDVAAFPTAPLLPLIEGANTLLTSEDAAHIRECSDESCRWLFLDHSKNHSRRWCSMQICGNRFKAKRFYERSRELTTEPLSAPRKR